MAEVCVGCVGLIRSACSGVCVSHDEIPSRLSCFSNVGPYVEAASLNIDCLPSVGLIEQSSVRVFAVTLIIEDFNCNLDFGTVGVTDKLTAKIVPEIYLRDAICAQSEAHS